MNRIPFSVYDFFGYLASGFLLIVAVDYVIGEQWVLREDLSVVLGLFWIVVAYIIGQIIAGIAATALAPNAWQALSSGDFIGGAVIIFLMVFLYFMSREYKKGRRPRL